MASAQETFPYIPSDEDYEKYKAGALETADPKDLPEGFPPVIESQPLWSTPGIKDQKDQWCYEFTDDDRESIDAAVKSFGETGFAPQALTPETFPLSESLKKTLGEARIALYKGHGFRLFRGIRQHDYTRQQRIFIHAGLTSYFGDTRGYITPVLENTPVLAHVTDLNLQKDSTSPAYTNGPMTFHTDLGDVVSIYTLNKGIGGGSFYLASAWAVYNKLAKQQPKALRTLSENFEMKAIISSTPRHQPLLHLVNGRVFLQSFRRQFTGPSGISLTDDQKYALNALHFAAKEESFEIDFEDGDLLLFNNLAVLHSRSQFHSGLEEEERANARHLLKLFVQDEELRWEIPDILKKQWAMMYDDRPGVSLQNLARNITLSSTGGEASTSVREETFDNYPPTDVGPVSWEQNG